MLKAEEAEREKNAPQPSGEKPVKPKRYFRP
jgi:hypothetical protein